MLVARNKHKLAYYIIGKPGEEKLSLCCNDFDFLAGLKNKNHGLILR